MSKKSYPIGEPIAPPLEEYCTKPTFDQDGIQVSSGILRNGQEDPDPIPMAPPVGFEAPPDLMTMIKTMVHNELINRGLDEAGFETFEESDDFEIYDDPLDPLTPYERVFEPSEPAGPPPAAPTVPSPAPAATASGGKEGGEEAGSPKQPAAAAPSAVPSTTST